MIKLDAQQVMRIAAESMTDPRTVSRIYEGKSSKRLTRERIATAAKKLRLPAPPSGE